jgi:hypothetical protein
MDIARLSGLDRNEAKDGMNIEDRIHQWLIEEMQEEIEDDDNSDRSEGGEVKKVEEEEDFEVEEEDKF